MNAFCLVLWRTGQQQHCSDLSLSVHGEDRRCDRPQDVHGLCIHGDRDHRHADAKRRWADQRTGKEQQDSCVHCCCSGRPACRSRGDCSCFGHSKEKTGWSNLSIFKGTRSSPFKERKISEPGWDVLNHDMFLSCTFLSNPALQILSVVIFSTKGGMFLNSGWHVLWDFRLDVLRQHVLRNASLLWSWKLWLSFNSHRLGQATRKLVGHNVSQSAKIFCLSVYVHCFNKSCVFRMFIK